MHIGIDASRITVKQRTGTENYSYQLVRALADVDTTNHYTLYFNHIPAIPPVSHANFTLKDMPMPRFWTQARLAVEMFRSAPDVLFVPAHTIPVLRPRKLKTVVTIHDLGAEYLKEYHQFPQRLYLNQSTVYATKHANHLIAVSEATRKDLIQKLQVPREKITVIYEGFDPKHFYKRSDKEVTKIQEKFNLKKDYLLFVGTIQPRKNLLTLIRAFNQMVKSNPKKYQDLKLVIAGKKGWLYEEILVEPAKLNIDDQVRFLGHVLDQDLPALYSGSLGFVFPSLYEGFGLPILEAMSAGVPVLTSKVSSLPEVAGQGALYVDPNDQGDIARKLERLVTDPKLRQELVEAGKKQLRLFSWRKAAEQTLEVLTRVHQAKP